MSDIVPVVALEAVFVEPFCPVWVKEDQEWDGGADVGEGPDADYNEVLDYVVSVWSVS